jgi:ATP-dependent DNA helicase RecG
LADAIGITPKGVEWQITRLKKDGLLRRTGPAKGGRWDVTKRK